MKAHKREVNAREKDRMAWLRARRLWRNGGIGILSRLYGERTGRAIWICFRKRNYEDALKARGGTHNYTKGWRQEELHA